MNKCIIIGAGAIGLLSARLLSDAGYDVQIIEQSEPGTESSWAGGGILSPLYPWRYPDSINQLATYGQKYYPGLVDALQLETGIDSELLHSGMLLLDEIEGETNNWAERWEHKVEYPKPGKALQAIQPGLTDEHQAATWLPDINQIRNPRLLAALLASTENDPNISLMSNTAVTSLEYKKNRVVAINTADQRIEADVVLVCAGAWSSRLIPNQNGELRKITPVKGQIIQFQASPDLLRCMIMKNSQYLIPRKDGKVLVGSTLEHTEFRKTTTDEAYEDLQQFAVSILPALADLPIVNHWAGLRPGTEQGIPLIGEHPTIEGLYVNAGHFRNGIIIGLGSAQLVTDLITGSSPVFDPKPYSIVRTS